MKCSFDGLAATIHPIVAPLSEGLREVATSGSRAAAQPKGHAITGRAEVNDTIEDASPGSEANKSNVDDTDSGTVCDAEFNDEHRAIFSAAFNSMSNDKKWLLKSGRYVEDVMYKAGMNFQYVSFCYLDADPNVASIFTPEERDEIQSTNVKHIPPFKEKGLFHSFYTKFAFCDSRAALRDMLYSKQVELQSSNESDEEFWHCQLYHQFLVDMDDADGSEVHGQEGDGYVRAFDGIARDLAATEVGLKWEGLKGTKLMTESLGKLPKVLRDIFTSNYRRGGSRETLLREMAVPGLAVYGPMSSLLVLDAPRGYVVRCKISDWKELSMSISKEGMQANGQVFARFLAMRMHVLRNEELISDSESVIDDPALDLLREFSSPKRRCPTKFTLPDTHPTPGKRSKKRRLSG
ncbi:hypothetical protein HDU85_006534 [Gaertneriomyces sp. JEL0708]|nr:hypothetical protein HDU85_006534 [Gaertneriomyces sp. JEL0708]